MCVRVAKQWTTRAVGRTGEKSIALVPLFQPA